MMGSVQKKANTDSKIFFLDLDMESNGCASFIKWLELNTDIFKRSIKREVNDKIPEEKTFKETINY